MASFSQILGRPVTVASAVAVIAVSSNVSDIYSHPRSSNSTLFAKPSNSNSTFSSSVKEFKSWVPQISISNIPNMFPLNFRPIFGLSNSHQYLSGLSSLPTASPTVLLSLYQSANLAIPTKPTEFSTLTTPSSSSSPSEALYRWHLPESIAANGVSGNKDCSSAKSKTVVVLLGWLGAQQKHLKRYADWYTSRGFHAVTFTFPMADIISYKVGGKAEEQIDLLVNHLAGWVGEEECGKTLVFHTFSNTGWLTYGVMLEKFQKHDPTLTGRIKGCIVDSAPVAAPDPQVWASGFSAAFLKKQSIATKGSLSLNELKEPFGTKTIVEPKPAVAEAALLVVLEKFFEVVLNLPTVNRRLSDVLDVLSLEQPKCPQLYIYSSADRVIPVKSVESFIEEQRRAGHEVRACDFVSTPHVDHFRNHPNLYTSQLTTFLEDCVLTCCKQDSST